MIREVGTLIRLRTTVRDVNGTATNSPTLTIAVTKPDGTALSPALTVTNTGSAGLYTADLTPAAAGLWRYAWTASSGVVAVTSDQLTVVATQRALVASMEEFKTHLNRTDITDDTELRTFLVAATDWVEETIGGPLAVTSFTERVFLHGSMVAPRRRPVVAVTSLTPDYSSALDVSTVKIDADTGVIYLSVSLSGWHTLVYTAGRTAITERVKLAGLMLAEHLWQTQNGGGGLPIPGDDNLAAATGWGFAVPNRVKELMATDVAPGFA